MDRITVNLAPAHLKEDGSGFVCRAARGRLIRKDQRDNSGGELAFDGSVLKGLLKTFKNSIIAVVRRFCLLIVQPALLRLWINIGNINRKPLVEYILAIHAIR